MEKTISADEAEITYRFHERLDFNTMTPLKNDFRKHTEQGTTFHFDFTFTRHIDSSALGLLLLIRDHAQSLGGKVLLVNMSTHIEDVFRQMRFLEIFEIA